MAKTRKTSYKKPIILGLVLTLLLAIASPIASSYAIEYGSGEYGVCVYGGSSSSSGCPIAMGNFSFNLVMPVTPTAGGDCTIQSDQVVVGATDPDGFTLTLQNSSTNTGLVNGSYSVPAVSGTFSSPAALSDDWGYNVPGEGGFGATVPPTEVNAAPNSSYIFAKTQPSSGTADNIVVTNNTSSSSINLTPVIATIYYGICADNALGSPPGSYSTTIIYTASANT
ncbi:MAG TPA: hypothetical protein VGF75_05430 [Candidatus Saccharimonadales bacterium]|jgi:hypothetical protein